MKPAPYLEPFFFWSTLQLWNYLYRLPLYSPSFSHLFNSKSQQAVPISNHPDAGALGRWAVGSRQARAPSFAIALRSPAPGLWSFTGFVGLALLEARVLFPLTILLQEAAWCHGGGVFERDQDASECFNPPYIWMTSGKPLHLSELHFLFETETKTPTLPSLTGCCETEVGDRCEVLCKL